MSWQALHALTERLEPWAITATLRSGAVETWVFETRLLAETFLLLLPMLQLELGGEWLEVASARLNSNPSEDTYAHRVSYTK